MYEVIGPTKVETIWPLIAPYIAQAIGDSDSWRDLDTIKAGCLSGSARIIVGRNVWQQIDVVLVTESWIQDGRNVLVLRWLWGREIDNWYKDIEQIENLAITHGFHAIQVWGRPGWIKKLKSLEYKHEFTVVGKPLIRGLH